MAVINLKKIQVAPTIPTLPLTNVQVTGAVKEGNIWWIPINTEFNVIADVSLPNGNYMIMIERVVDAVNAIDDARFVGVVSEGVITITGKFTDMGNYVATDDRMNRGLDRIGKGVHLQFDDIEFNAHY